MKNLTSQEEGVWRERLIPTELQLETLKNGTEEEKKVVISALNTTPSAADVVTAKEIYNQHRPTVENYSFISCDLTIEEQARGIINFNIRGEHRQIRF